MTPRLLLIAALSVITVTTLGCATLYKSRPEQLKVAVRTFNENVRWKRFRAAADRVPEDRREAWVRGMQRAGAAYTITDYEFSPVEIGDDKAIIQVDLTYHAIHGVVVKPMRRQQVWRWENNDWELESDSKVEIVKEQAPPATAIPDFLVDEDEASGPASAL